MKYLQVLQSKSDIGNVVVPSVYYIKDTEEVLYYGDSFLPLTFVAREDDMTVSFTGTCAYSLDGSTWVDLPANTATPAINTGEKIFFRKEVSSTSSSIGTFSATKTFDLKGNIMSMLFGQHYIEKYSLAGYSNCFQSLFASSSVVDDSKLYLPATTLANYCYYNMFNGCTGLTSAPELPATTLANYCYYKMFHGCSSLTSAPELPATTLAEGCYYNMFYGCSSLTSAPELPATTLANYCYRNMFTGCSSLTSAPELPATTLANYCYYNMFYGCSSLTSAPELPATTLANYCYYNMFHGCSELTKIVMLATDISATGALSDWVSRVAASGTFVKAAGVTIPSGNSGIPNGWTVEER